MGGCLLFGNDDDEDESGDDGEVVGLVDGDDDDAEGEDREEDERGGEREEEEAEPDKEEEEEEWEEDVHDVSPGSNPLRTPCTTVRYQPASFSSAVAARRWSCGWEEQALQSSVAEMARVASRLEVSMASRVRGPGGW